MYAFISVAESFTMSRPYSGTSNLAGSSARGMLILKLYQQKVPTYFITTYGTVPVLVPPELTPQNTG